ncbi:hypothetical protein HW571_28500 [Agrobacterium genomosp. 3]|jgi:hypothetical protein|uniref:Uncharacterized protein n=1 Tax=Rhizobium oryzihabitans TaxID=2267833 RepID=A0A7L5BR05_9HYPH|nr:MULTISPECIES: hypothetical protein [Rhizobiaceae]MCA1869555.1 hypothetical protein [Agrobacterium tomkonis]MCA1879900.1 hypothetical protein [Agrobacterium tumefaciens]MCB8828087.1 hypothetical protein [Escherichia coli]MCT6836159.1 hypothetical protein [Bifidobacteriales bacterium]MDH0913212.1 hypothetical protein [Agrobacterium pusense]
MPSDHVDEPTLDEFTIPHVAFAAAEHYAVFPTAEKHELIQTLKRDVEARFARERENVAGHAAALKAIEDADARGLLEVIYGQGD